MEYTCPMHPEVIRSAPGSCPVCGMDLVKKNTATADTNGDEHAHSHVSPVQDTAAALPMVTPARRTETGSATVFGTVEYDPEAAGAISSFTAGRIEKLYLRYKYQRVEKGQKVMEIYSPELATAQQNLLFIMRNDRGNTSLAAAARSRLLLLGMRGSEIDRIISTGKVSPTVTIYSRYSGYILPVSGETAARAGMDDITPQSPASGLKEGKYVQKGEVLFSVYNARRARILLDIFPEYQQAVRVGDTLTVIPETSPQITFRSRIDYIEPAFRSGSKTLKARSDFNNARMLLPAGSRIKATVTTKPVDGYWLPRQSVISTGRENIVFAKTGASFRATRIRTGVETDSHIQVIHGIGAGDSVARNAQYLFDNEAFIKTN